MFQIEAGKPTVSPTLVVLAGAMVVSACSGGLTGAADGGTKQDSGSPNDAGPPYDGGDSGSTTDAAIAADAGLCGQTVPDATNTGGWFNLSPNQTAPDELTVELLARPRGNHSVVGIGNGTARGFSDLVANIRFNEEGAVDARDDASYRADSLVTYSENTWYRVRFVLRGATRRYDVSIGECGGSMAPLLTNANYRGLGSNLLNQLSSWADVGSGIDVASVSWQVGSCNPSTCSELSAECGPVEDGCGATLDCGECGAEQTCNARNQCLEAGVGTPYAVRNFGNAYCLHRVGPDLAPGLQRGDAFFFGAHIRRTASSAPSPPPTIFALSSDADGPNLYFRLHLEEPGAHANQLTLRIRDRLDNNVTAHGYTGPPIVANGSWHAVGVLVQAGEQTLYSQPHGQLSPTTARTAAPMNQPALALYALGQHVFTRNGPDRPHAHQFEGDMVSPILVENPSAAQIAAFLNRGDPATIWTTDQVIFAPNMDTLLDDSDGQQMVRACGSNTSVNGSIPLGED